MNRGEPHCVKKNTGLVWTLESEARTHNKITCHLCRGRWNQVFCYVCGIGVSSDMHYIGHVGSITNHVRSFRNLAKKLLDINRPDLVDVLILLNNVLVRAGVGGENEESAETISRLEKLVEIPLKTMKAAHDLPKKKKKKKPNSNPSRETTDEYRNVSSKRRRARAAVGTLPSTPTSNVSHPKSYRSPPPVPPTDTKKQKPYKQEKTNLHRNRSLLQNLNDESTPGNTRRSNRSVGPPNFEA